MQIREPNGSLRFWITLLPSDPYFGLLWNLRNNGQTGGKVGADIDISWRMERHGCFFGREVVVAVIDTGVDLHARDLKDKMWVNRVRFRITEWTMTATVCG